MVKQQGRKKRGFLNAPGPKGYSWKDEKPARAPSVVDAGKASRAGEEEFRALGFSSGLFAKAKQPKSGPLAERFEFPPFTVLDSRSGTWQDRKAAWIGMGIESEVGRGPDVLRAGSGGRSPGWDGKRTGKDRWKGNVFFRPTSVFDPVVCELVSRWFCPEGGLILDPFAGGSVRGIVAALTGRRYHGIELRMEQVSANGDQRFRLLDRDARTRIEWVCGDCLSLLAQAPEADAVFTCPPYGDLERYSDDPRDLSTMTWGAFLEALGLSLRLSTERLRHGGYSCWVVGDFRDERTGFLRALPAELVRLARRAGLALYNDAVLIARAGSLPLRIGSQFEKGRKLGRSHQYLLVFKRP